MIELYCQHCGQRMEIADQYAGQTGTCKSCGKQVDVPASASESPPKPIARAHSASVPYKWIGAAVGVLAFLAIGVYAWIGKDSDSPRRQAGPSGEGPLPERTLHFPDDRDYGALGIRDWGDPSERTFRDRPLGEARGEITVPAGQDLRAELSAKHSGALYAYAALHPNALQALRINADYGFVPNELEYISHMTGIEDLKILKANRENLDLSLISQMTNLRVLDIREAKISIDGLRALSGLNKLEHLTLWGSDVPSFGLQYLSDKTLLTYLDLDFNPIDDSGIAYLKDLHELEVLLLAHNQLTDAGLETLLQFPKLRFLVVQVYDRFDGGWTDEGMRYIAQLENIRRLNIVNHKLTAEGFRQLKNLSALRNLVMSPNIINPEIAQALSELTQIETLDLPLTKQPMTNEQLTWLHACTHLKRLILLGQRSVTDEHVPALSGFTFLQTLNVRGNPISPEGIQTLRDALPNTNVIH